MWIYFNNNGQLLETLEHGNPARAGSTDFEIFAFFEGVNIDVSYDEAMIKLYKPDFNHSSYDLLGMTQATKTFHLLEDEHSIHFQDGQEYVGYHFDFSNFSLEEEMPILLDTPGLWEAVIALLGAGGQIDVQGKATFSVENTNYDEDETELPLDTVLSNIFLQLAQKLNIKSGRYMRVVDGFESFALHGFPEAEFNIGDILYNKQDNSFYRLTGFLYQPGVNPELIVENEIAIEDIDSSTSLDDMKGRPVIIVYNDVYYMTSITETSPGYFTFQIQDMASEDMWSTSTPIANTTIASIIGGTTYYNPLALLSDIKKIYQMSSPSEILSDEDYDWLYSNPNSRIFYNNRYYEKAFINGPNIYFTCANPEISSVDGIHTEKTYVVLLNTTLKRLNAGTFTVDSYEKSQIDTLLAQKQNTLVFDNAPTTGSTNPVTSGGVASAISNATTRTNLVSVIGEATAALSGLMSATDKDHLDTLYQLISDAGDDPDQFVDTIREILEIFQNYPEGQTIIDALAAKVNVSDIVNNLTTDSAVLPLSAAQGVVLNERIEDLEDKAIYFEVENHSSTNVVVVFEKNKDKKIVNTVSTTSVIFAIPSTVTQGWVASGTLQISGSTAFSISNNSAFTVYCILDGRVKDITEWQANISANITLEVMAECNGYNIRLFAKQIGN